MKNIIKHDRAQVSPVTTPKISGPGSKKQRRKNITGHRYGRLVVVGDAEMRGPHRRLICDCDCGNQHIISYPSWKKTKSCGCLRKEKTAERARARKGVSRRVFETRGFPEESAIYFGMCSRCSSTLPHMANSYKSRGIQVCDSWMESFDNFFSDMGPRPGPQFTLERIDNDLGYSPDNCKWATWKEQHRNKSNSQYVVFRGETMIVSQFARVIGRPRTTVRQRLKEGMSPDDIASEVDVK